MVEFAKRAYALCEPDMPFQVKVERTDKDLVDVKSVGYDDFGGQLTHNCSAHPKVDRKTNQFYVFCYSVEKPLVQVSVFNKERKIERHLQF